MPTNNRVTVLTTTYLTDPPIRADIRRRKVGAR